MFSLHIPTKSSIFIFDEKCIPFQQTVYFYKFIVAQFFLVGYKKFVRKQRNKFQNFQNIARLYATSSAVLRRYLLRTNAVPNRADSSFQEYKREKSV